MRDIGLNVVPPESECNDRNCPFHGVLPVRGQILNGLVENAKMDKTIVISHGFRHLVRKYQRYEKRRNKIPAHLPPCISVEQGDLVTIAECRPISKTVHFVVVEKQQGD